MKTKFINYIYIYVCVCVSRGPVTSQITFFQDAGGPGYSAGPAGPAAAEKPAGPRPPPPASIAGPGAGTARAAARERI